MNDAQLISESKQARRALADSKIILQIERTSLGQAVSEMRTLIDETHRLRRELLGITLFDGLEPPRIRHAASLTQPLGSALPSTP